ncbi:MAG: hypothetical protein KJ077_25440 [Anaerolineae bacterium]|nr:hypothetical protein [Anaerolineae bacterium]
MKTMMTKVSANRWLAVWLALLAGLTLLAAPGAWAAPPALPTYRVAISVHHPDNSLVTDGLNGLFHTSQNNTWLNFSQDQPDNVSVSGPARVQFVNGTVQAEGVVAIRLEAATLQIDLGQLDGDDDNPFELPPGGGCLENLTGLLTTPENPEGELIPLHFHFSLPDTAS